MHIIRELITMSSIAYLELADKWCESLERRELKRLRDSGESFDKKPIDVAREKIAGKIGVAPGSLFNLRNKRLKGAGIELWDGLRRLLIKELQSEMRRHEQEITILRELGGPASDLDLLEAEAQLAKIKEALTNGGGI